MDKIPVYMMPGLAASSRIFERISLDENKYEVVLLDWFMPFKNETLHEYCIRFCKEKIHHSNPVLIGVSFGGVIVQEIARLIEVRKIIIISSVKSNREFPKRMILAKYLRLYKILPTHLVKRIRSLTHFPFPTRIEKRIQLYRKYMSYDDSFYLDWSIQTIVLWDRSEPDPRVIHIQGKEDRVFPIKNIKNCIGITGKHIMILNRYKWFNENLPKLIS